MGLSVMVVSSAVHNMKLNDHTGRSSRGTSLVQSDLILRLDLTVATERESMYLMHGPSRTQIEPGFTLKIIKILVIGFVLH